MTRIEVQWTSGRKSFFLDQVASSPGWWEGTDTACAPAKWLLINRATSNEQLKGTTHGPMAQSRQLGQQLVVSWHFNMCHVASQDLKVWSWELGAWDINRYHVYYGHLSEIARSPSISSLSSVSDRGTALMLNESVRSDGVWTISHLTARLFVSGCVKSGSWVSTN